MCMVPIQSKLIVIFVIFLVDNNIVHVIRIINSYVAGIDFVFNANTTMNALTTPPATINDIVKEYVVIDSISLVIK